ncbi:MAG: OmpA family protein [Saprospiraceae bacterium]|nr:OmpA family protein [Bacteroidia bacterium]NNK90589.1 OmpA family protein [Saprospiraceae bacterium]
MARRLTIFSKLIITILILALLFFGGQWLLNNTQVGENLKNKAEQEQANNNSGTSDAKSSSEKKSGGLFNRSDSEGDENTLKVQLVMWGGYAPGLYFNEGAEANTRSRFYKDYNMKVDFKMENDLMNALNAWIADEYDVLVQTADAFSFYTAPDDLASMEPKAFMQVDWSRGGDAIIVKRGIKTVNDLKGKKIALAVPAPAQTMLVTALESAGLSIDDVQLVKTSDNLKAAELFRSPDVDAAVVWSPDDIIATRDVPGSKILLTTREQSHIIGDIMFAKQSVIDSKKELFDGFYEGWMRAVAELKNPGNAEKAAKYLAEFCEVSVEDAKGMMDNVYYTSHGDNINFFGLNNSFRGMKGGDLYDKMNQRFVQMGDNEKLGPSWRSVISTGPIRSADSKLQGTQYSAEKDKDFRPASSADKTIPAFATKPVSINFATGQFTLSENAKTIIDLQFAEIAKSFGNVKVRVEGNTDNVGGRQMNMELSRKRAQSVAGYLQASYGMNPNRFVIVGNGPDKPVTGCETNATESCKAKNRRTEFQLIPA